MIAGPKPTAAAVAAMASPAVPLDFDSLHDLSGPVNQICSMIDLILKKHGGTLGEAEPLLGFVQTSAHRLENLLAGLRSFAQVLGAPIRRQLCDMNTILAAALISAQRAIESSEAIVIHDRLPEVDCDFSKMAYVFGALIDNSIKFRGERRPEIRIAATPEPDGWLFSVRDNGIGIDPGYRSRVFSVFKRVQRDAYPGAGVGLAIVKRIVELHGGHTWFDSIPRQGATCFLALPGVRA